jgi:hypothetical protein
MGGMHDQHTDLAQALVRIDRMAEATQKLLGLTMLRMTRHRLKRVQAQLRRARYDAKRLLSNPENDSPSAQL